MRTFGLLGRSLGHSFSQKYFRNKFEKLNLQDCDYLLFELSEVNLFNELLSSRLEIAGLNVTIPYKKEIIGYLDEVSPEAKEIGAVNTIQFAKGGRKVGHNTDVIGFEKCLRPVLQGHMERALILGNGGAAAAVAYVLRKVGIPYHFVSRSQGDLCVTYDQLSETVIGGHFLIINTTPVGQYPEVENAPLIPYEAIGPMHTCLDLVYNPTETEFMRRCRERGAWTDNGLSMLYAQADASWEIWNS
jgi:shikimate dehydrogenase